MHDLDVARHAVDSLMEALDEATSATVEGAYADPSIRVERSEKTGENLVIAYQRLARVRVRLSDNSPAVKTARELLNRTADLAHDLEDQVFALVDDDPRLREIRMAHDRFYAAAYETVGTHLSEHRS